MDIRAWVDIREVLNAIFYRTDNGIKDYEQLPEHYQGFVYVAMIRLMLRRLTTNLPSIEVNSSLQTASQHDQLA